jgi:hypothetical protein
MNQIYKRWMEDWENRLAFKSTDRVVRPFEWGMEWTEQWPCARLQPRNGHSPEQYLRALNKAIGESSGDFFDYEPPTDFRLDGNILRYTSPVHTPYPENNLVHAQWFPSKKSQGRAVVVLPHFNARAEQHAGLCKGLALLGISALRLSLPYHDYRMPAELHRADYAVSANLGRTMDATRQAVIDTRAAYNWLESIGYNRLGIVGTSLGSCYAFLISAHDDRLRANVFNHCATYFGDVVWTGLSTRHIRQGLEGHIDVDRLRDAWRAISPVSYLEQYKAKRKKSKFIYTTYDTTFLPEFSRDIVARIRAAGIESDVVVLPCGHYTMGETPFKFIDGYHICSFLLRWL